MRISAHGLAVDLPDGWEGRIFAYDDGLTVLHAGNFALPPDEAGFGSTATQNMPPGSVFLALLEYPPSADLVPGQGLYAAIGVPTEKFGPDAFDAHVQQILRPGRAGLQRFFSVGNRAFCLYCLASLADGLTKGPAPSLTGLDAVIATIDIDSS